MKIKKLFSKEEQDFYLIEGVTCSFINSLRRVMISEIPVMAIEDVEIRENSSVLYDEMLALRLGLLALKTDLKSYNRRDKCSCNGEGCAKCEALFVLKAKGPCNVYASDLECKDPNIVPVHPKTLLVKLGKNQNIELEAKAILGIGKEHMKWNCCHVYYFNQFYIDNQDLKKVEEVVNNCIKKDEKLAVVVDKNKQKEIHLCDACQQKLEKENIVIKQFNDKFIFVIEPFGQLEVNEIMEEAIKVLKNKAEEFVNLL